MNSNINIVELILAGIIVFALYQYLNKLPAFILRKDPTLMLKYIQDIINNKELNNDNINQKVRNYSISLKQRAQNISFLFLILLSGILLLSLRFFNNDLMYIINNIGLLGSVFVVIIILICTILMDLKLWDNIVEDLIYKYYTIKWDQNNKLSNDSYNSKTKRITIDRKAKAIQQNKTNYPDPESIQSGSVTPPLHQLYQSELLKLTEVRRDKIPVHRCVCFFFLLFMWIVTCLNVFISEDLKQPELAQMLFILRSNHIEYVWTWITAMFTHGSFLHLLINSIVLFSFGITLERSDGSKKITALFLFSGITTCMASILIYSFLAQPNYQGVTAIAGVVGSSGAILAILGALTVKKPTLPVFLFFMIPLPLWIFTLGFTVISIFIIISQNMISSFGISSVSHLGHLIGLGIGLVYGFIFKDLNNDPRGGPHMLDSLATGLRWTPSD